MKRFFKFALISLFALVGVTGCGKEEISETKTKEVTDLMNRKVEIPTEINKVICIGAGSLRLYSYVGDMNKLSGVELIEKTNAPMKLPKRPYQVAYQELFDKLPQCGVGGPKGQQADNEKILACNPDVVFSTIKDVEAMNKITNDTKKPVVILNYGSNGAFELDESKNALKQSISLIGEVINKQTRAKEVNDYIQDTIKDISNRTKGIKEEDKPSVYYGALGNFGMHGLNSSQPNYPMLEIANIKNILNDTGLTNKKEMDIDEEILNKIDPKYVFIDAGGINNTITQIKDSSDPLSKIYKNWTAFKENKAFVVLPYKVYFMQIENGLLDAYYISKTVYPEQFKDVDVSTLAKEVYTKFYGNDFYETYLEKAQLNGVAFNNFKYE